MRFDHSKSPQRTAQHSALSTQHSLATCSETYGPGPEGWRCGSCANLSAVHVRTPGGRSGQLETIYYCCLDGTARRVTALACSRFEEAAQKGSPNGSRS